MPETRQAFTKQTKKTMSSQESVKLIVYSGTSMSSIFQDMDVLYYMPSKRIRPGDVVVINIPGYEYKFIHRIISVGKNGIRTMGDCSPQPDNWLLKPDQVLGYVAYGYRGNRRFGVLNGPAGLANMFLFRIKYLTIRAVSPFLSAMYRNFPISNLVMHLIRPKLVAFKRPGGIELHLLCRGKVIGRRPPGQKWEIRTPFRYIIDENSLHD